MPKPISKRTRVAISIVLGLSTWLALRWTFAKGSMADALGAIPMCKVIEGPSSESPDHLRAAYFANMHCGWKQGVDYLAIHRVGWRGWLEGTEIAAYYRWNGVFTPPVWTADGALIVDAPNAQTRDTGGRLYQPVELRSSTATVKARGTPWAETLMLLALPLGVIAGGGAYFSRRS